MGNVDIFFPPTPPLPPTLLNSHPLPHPPKIMMMMMMRMLLLITARTKDLSLPSLLRNVIVFVMWSRRVLVREAVPVQCGCRDTELARDGSVTLKNYETILRRLRPTLSYHPYYYHHYHRHHHSPLRYHSITITRYTI